MTLPRLLFLATMVAAGALLFRKLDLEGIAVDEATSTVVEVEMLREGHWFFPTFRGDPEARKPPLSMWLSALSLETLGENEFALRFPAALLGLGTIALVFAWAARLGGAVAGATAALALVTVPEFLFDHCARTNLQDSPLLFFTTASTLAYVYGPPTAVGALAAGVLAGLGLLSKGVGGLAALAIVAVYELFTSRLRSVLSLRPWLFAAVAFAVAAIWFVPEWMVARAHLGAELDKDFGGRIFGSGLFHRWPFHFLKLWKNLGFWLLALPIGVVLLVRDGDRRNRLAPIAAAVVMLIFTAAGAKYPWYALPAYPAIVVMIGAGVAAGRHLVPQSARSFAAGSIAAIVALLFAPPYARAWQRSGEIWWEHSSLRAFERWASATLPPEVPVVLYNQGIDHSFAGHETFYAWKLRKRLQSVDSAAALCAALDAAPKGAFAIVADRKLAEAACLTTYPASIRLAKLSHASPSYIPMRIVPYKFAAPPFFAPAEVVLDAENGLGFVSGWSEIFDAASHRRRVTARSAFVSVELEPAAGAALAVKGSWSASEGCAPALRWNGVSIGTLAGADLAEFTLSPAALANGVNVLELVRPCETTQVAIERVVVRPHDDGAGGPPDVAGVYRHYTFGGHFAGRELRDSEAPDGRAIAYGKHSTDPPTYLFFAPMRLQAGRYRASFSLRGRGVDEGSVAAIVDVVGEKDDKRRFARRELRLGEIVPDAGYETVDLDFTLFQPESIEPRVEARGAGAEVRVGGVTVRSERARRRPGSATRIQ